MCALLGMCVSCLHCLPCCRPRLVTRGHKVCTCVYACVSHEPWEGTCHSLGHMPVSDKGAFAFISFSYVLFGEKPHLAMRGGWLFFISQQLRVLGAGVAIRRSKLGEFRECWWSEGL